MFNCIICGKTQPLMYKDFRGQYICMSHTDAITCAGCTCYIADKSRARYIGSNAYICEKCNRIHVTADNMETFIRQTLNILYDAGFQDIQRDWITIDIVSRRKMAELVNWLSASGVHYEQSPSKLSIRGRYDFDQKVSVLDFLSPIMFMETLGHELIHSWQLQNNISDYIEYSQNENAKKACEGFANIGSYIVLDSFDNAKFNTEIRAFVRHRKDAMLRSTDPIYGISFQKIMNHFPECDKKRWLLLIKAARQSKIREIVK